MMGSLSSELAFTTAIGSVGISAKEAGEALAKLSALLSSSEDKKANKEDMEIKAMRIFAIVKNKMESK